jgi:hypothetical protein
MEKAIRMKKILIISPHFPPSNLAGVHRSRLFAQHLPEFGWQPIILTVHEKYYEEKLDHGLTKLLPVDLRVEKVNAFKISKPKIIGDIGLRGFFQLYKKAKHIIKTEKIDFLYIPIPSFYVALLGRWLNKSTGVKYGIDYIDPWVHNFPGSNKLFSRHWISTKMAKILEPIAIKKASLITGVADGYFDGVKIRNPKLLKTALFGAMPYGGEKSDHEKVRELNLKPYLFKKETGKTKLVYAGAMLPKAYKPLEAIFKVICINKSDFLTTKIYFIGTGKSPNDKNGFNIKPLALKYGLWEKQIFEYPARIPYLDVLIHLENANGVFILGSTEPHYTPSKVYQGVLSAKPILAVLHSASTAVQVIRGSNVGIVLSFNGEEDMKTIENNFLNYFNKYQVFANSFCTSNVNMNVFEQYSAKNITKQLADLLNHF